MKKFSSRNLTVTLVLIASFFTSLKIQSQPQPDVNFCSVHASLIYNDSVCIVGGQSPEALYYDDNEFDDFLIWIEAGGMVAVKFTPGYYPAQVLGGYINVGDGSYPENSDFIGSEVKIFVFDDNGSDNLPGTALDSATLAIDNYGWIQVEGLSAIIQEGDFYLGMEQLNSYQTAAPIAIDTDLPNANKSFTKRVNESWEFSLKQDFMIRAAYCHTDSLNNRENSENYPLYEIARVSGFNPENGEGPEDGMVTILDTLNYFYYHDTSFYSLLPGYYAYAVKVYFDDGDSTGWYFTNTLQKQLVGFEDNIIEETIIHVYPNPANGELNVEAGETIYSICLVNVLGEIVYYGKFNQKSILINTSQLREGVYVAKIETKTGLKNKKILLKK